MKHRKKKNQKRFNKPYEILAEINKLRLRRKRHIDAAMEFEAQYQAFKIEANTEGCKRVNGLGILMKELEDQACNKRETARIISDIKIPRLGRLLSEINTVPMPFLADGSVALDINK